MIRPRRLLGILLIVAIFAGSVVTSLARSGALPSAYSMRTPSIAAQRPQFLGAVHPGILAAFQLLASVTALVAFSPDPREN